MALANTLEKSAKFKRRIANPARIGRRATAPPQCFAPPQNQMQQVPLFITQFSQIQGVSHRASLAVTLAQITSTHPKNDFPDTSTNVKTGIHPSTNWTMAERGRIVQGFFAEMFSGEKCISGEMKVR
jgi:hypothetical protein